MGPKKGIADVMHATQSSTNIMFVPGIGAHDDPTKKQSMRPTLKSSTKLFMDVKRALVIRMMHRVSRGVSPLVVEVVVVIVVVLEDDDVCRVPLRARDNGGNWR